MTSEKIVVGYQYSDMITNKLINKLCFEPEAVSGKSDDIR